MIDRGLLLYCKIHEDNAARQTILKQVGGMILKMANMFGRKYPEIDTGDFAQEAYISALTCIEKNNPLNGAFGFPKYLKQSIYRALRRYALKNVRQVKRPERVWLSATEIPADYEITNFLEGAENKRQCPLCGGLNSGLR